MYGCTRYSHGPQLWRGHGYAGLLLLPSLGRFQDTQVIKILGLADEMLPGPVGVGGSGSDGLKGFQARQVGRIPCSVDGKVPDLAGRRVPGSADGNVPELVGWEGSRLGRWKHSRPGRLRGIQAQQMETFQTR